MFNLHAMADDWSLNALADTERSDGLSANFLYYLTDELGNYLTDESGNRLVGYEAETVYPQMLHALPDDFVLNAE